LSLNEAIQTNNVRVKLSGPPDVNMNVAFAQTSLRFDTCSALTFTSNNWDTWQTIRLAAPPVYSAARQTAYSIPFTMRNAATNTVVASTSYNVNRTPVTGAVASSSGDPHYTQFNGFYYSDQTPSTVYLVNHEHFSVQALQQWCNGKRTPSCNQAVAIRYGSSALVIDARDNTVRVGRLTSNNDGIVYSSSGPNSHVVSFPDGSYVSMVASQWSATFGVHISISVGIAPHWSGYDGIFSHPSVPRGTYRLPGGQTTTNPNTFTRAWIVPPADNLFNGNVKKTVPTFTPNFCNRPTTLFTDALAMHTVRYTVANPQKRQVDTSANGVPDFDALAAKLPAAFLNNARSVCNTTISSTSACASVTDTGAVVESCYRDAILTNSLNFTGAHLQNFNQLCLGMTRSLEDLGTDEATFQALMIQQQAGLGEFPCPSNCNSRGKCLEFGCECNAGFSGNACQIKL